MAWREVRRKGIRVSFAKALTSTAVRDALVSKSLNTEEKVKALSASVRCIPDFFLNQALRGADSCKFSTQWPLIRCFHASAERLARTNDQPLGLKTPSKGKFVKKGSRTQPPVDAPYVPPKMKRSAKSADRIINIFEGMTIVELAKETGESIRTLQDIIVNVGEKVDSEFDALSIDVAELVAMEVGVNVRRLHSNEGAEVLSRPAVVTVMGHVDHGKTSLLDALRQTSVAAKEAGGITQHLGAFVVSMPSGSSITFLDTPGHAAFSAMRARGAAVTDIVVLVVAADDGVMPQTLEAMSHAKAANVPIVVAINKCDKPAADPERVRVQLASEGLPLEDMGGDVQVVEVSATNKIGLDKLEEALLLQADLMDLKARIDGPAQAYVVEARLDRGRGPLATAIVKAGTLVCGQYVVVGAEWGRIRAIRDTAGKLSERAGPAMPVEIEGLRGLPMAGDDITVVESEERARMLSAGRTKKLEKDRLTKMDEEKIETPDPSEQVSKRVEMAIIVKADVQDTVQAVIDALKSLNSPQVFVDVVHVGVGPISQSDVDLAQVRGACIVGFNLRNPPGSVSMAATRASIKIKVHRVMYHLVEDIRSLIAEKLPKRVEMPIIVKADVQGTVQAVTDALKSLNSPQVFVNVVHVGVGPISQSDVDLAQACGACIVGFNVRNPPSSISMAATQASIKIKVHRVIYHLLEDIGNLIVEKAPGTFETQVAGEAQVLNIFEILGKNKAKGNGVKIAGCRVTDGRVIRSSTMRLLRSGEVVFEGSCASLKREKQDVETVGKGTECGLVIKDFFDFQIGDVIQCLEEVNRKPKFISSESGAVRIEC